MAGRVLIAVGPSPVVAPGPGPDIYLIVNASARPAPRSRRSIAADGPQGSVVTVQDVMTQPVVVVHARTTFHDIASLLRRHRISGLPVVDDDQRLVGVVSESDLLRRLIRSETRRVFEGQGPASASVRESRATADTAGGLMSRPVVSTTPGASVDQVLDLMRRCGVRRLPVTDAEQRVIGIVTRTDLLQPYTCTDEELTEDLLSRVLAGLGVDRAQVRLAVREGWVWIGGTLPDPELVTRVEEAVRDTPGVVCVESTLRGWHPPDAPTAVVA